MNIIEALKADSSQVRVTSGNTWMYWDEVTNEWAVMTHRYKSHHSTEIYRGESDAVAALLSE